MTIMRTAFALLLFAMGAAHADETVNVGGTGAVLLRPASPHGSVILMAGGNGYIGAMPGGSLLDSRATSSCARARPTRRAV